MTHARLSEAPQQIAGLVVPNGEGLSKRQRIELALENLTQEALARLALKFAAHRGDIALDEAGRKVLEAGDPPLTHITRRDVVRVLGDDLAGERGTVETVEPYFVLSAPLEGMFGSGGQSLRDQIEQHMDRNPGDWSVKFLFGEIGAFDCSRARFAALLEAAVHPLARSGEDQLQTVAALNKVLARDGYELAQESELSGHPIFAFHPVVRGVGGRPKNLIFASRGPKPEIGFADAINNDIVILSGEESCLVYDRPITGDGLLWSELVAWWSEVTPGNNAANLGARLQESLASKRRAQALRHLVQALSVRPWRGAACAPAPSLSSLRPRCRQNVAPSPSASASAHGLLAPPARASAHRAVDDGQHHFSEDGRPSLKVYADMVSADRELRLAGYEGYRFGANKLVGEGAEPKIIDFFDKLFRLHRARGCAGY
jgi:hypothetical protein